MRFFIFLLFLLLPLAVSANEQTAEIAGKKVYVWDPQTQRKAPVVVFSHGFNGCATNARYLAEALAADGYWVFAPNHADAHCGKKGGFSRPSTPFGKPEEWDDKTYADRRDDIKNLLEALVDDKTFSQKIDFLHIGLMGHSLGGYTVMGMAGAWPSWKLPAARAVLALSPYSQAYVAKNTLSGISTPIMYQGGTRDIGLTPALKKPEGTYALTPQNKYLVVLDGAGHFAWTDLNSTFHPSINHYALAFFDYYLKGNASAGKLLMEKLADVKTLDYDSAIGKTTPIAAQDKGQDDSARSHIRKRIRSRLKGQ